MPQLYKGYEVRRSMLTNRWVGYPTCDVTTENKLEAPTAQALAEMIDAIVAANALPWDLPLTA